MKHLKVSQKYISIYRQIDSKNIQMLNIVAIFMNIFMGLIVIPVLVDIFNNIKEEFRGYTDITDVIESYPWFKSVVRAYNAVERNKMTMGNIYRLWGVRVCTKTAI